MGSRAEEIASHRLRAILIGIPTGATIGDSPEFRDALTGLEWFLPEVLAEIHPEWTGETLDAIANGISWVVLIIGPIIGIAAFWMVHILPEKIAEKKKHPQTKAIQCVCLLSLCFGGLLWPFAWLWAYTKPVLHKMAYGTDVDESHGHAGEEVIDEKREIEKLRARVAELEAKTRGS